MRKAKIGLIMKKSSSRNHLLIKLQMEGHKVYIAPEGDDVLNIMERMAVEMILIGETADLDYIQYLEMIKKKDSTKNIPVIAVLTESMNNSEIVNILQKGAVDIVYIKDDNFQKIVNVVDEVFGVKDRKFDVTVKTSADNVIMTVLGDLNRENTSKLRKHFIKMVKSTELNYIIDLSDAQYIESAGLGLLISMQKSLDGIGKTIKFVVKSSKIEKLFALVKLDKYFDIYESLDEIIKFPEVDDDKIKVAIIDDTKFMRKLMRGALEPEGFCIAEYENPVIALRELDEFDPDIILVDYEMPEMNGLEFIEKFKPAIKEIPTVMITTMKEIDLALKAIRLGASDFLNKPFERAELIHTLRKIVRENNLKKENERLFFEIKAREKELNKKNKQLSELYSSLEEELKMASEVQRKLLPESFPELERYKFAAKYLPSQDIGGDFYDFIEMPNGYTAVAFADISGHGIPAALLSTMFKVYLTSYCSSIISPGEAMETINELAVETFPEGKFISLFYLVINTELDKITYCKASQEPALYVKNDGTIQELETRGQVLGLFSSFDFPDMVKYGEAEVTMEVGEKIFLYTDGIIEAQNRQNEFYGLEKLKDFVLVHKDKSAEEIIELAHKDLLKFLDGVPILDDLTLLVIEKRC